MCLCMYVGWDADVICCLALCWVGVCGRGCARLGRGALLASWSVSAFLVSVYIDGCAARRSTRTYHSPRATSRHPPPLLCRVTRKRKPYYRRSQVVCRAPSPPLPSVFPPAPSTTARITLAQRTCFSSRPLASVKRSPGFQTQVSTELSCL